MASSRAPRDWDAGLTSFRLKRGSLVRALFGSRFPAGRGSEGQLSRLILSGLVKTWTNSRMEFIAVAKLKTPQDFRDCA